MVDKITSPPTAQSQIDKINEIIDNLGSGSGGASYTATCPAITPVDGVATWTVTHNLGSQAVVTALYSNNNKIEHNTLITSNNALTVTFKASSAVSAGDYRIVVLASGSSGGGSGADIDLSNISDIAKVTIAHNAAPSDLYEDLELGADGTAYYAPADGYVTFGKKATGGGQSIGIYTRDSSNKEIGGCKNISYNDEWLYIILQVRKGQQFRAYWTAYGSTDWFRFIYAVGSESEAS